MKNINVLIFGAGEFYEKHKGIIERNFNILFFLDNDEMKCGHKINDIPIMQPEKILDLSFDVVFVMSEAFCIEIKHQLLSLGVPYEKIVIGRAVYELSDINIVNFIQNKSFSSERILLACMPKSGSTYMRKVFGLFPGFREVSFVPEYGGREQEICEHTIQKLVTTNCNFIAQHHVRYSTGTLSVINTFDLKVIVLVRNIFDVILSFYDHWLKESTIFPMAFVPSDWECWEKDKAYEFIIDMIVPWYFNFYMSWLTCSIKDNVVFVNYDDFMKNKPKVMADICQELQIKISDTDINQAFGIIETKKTRKNVGESGRGSTLSDALKSKVKHMSNYYKGVDFSFIGL